MGKLGAKTGEGEVHCGGSTEQQVSQGEVGHTGI